MDALLKNKLKGLFWDMPPGKRDSTIKNIINNPIVASQDEQTAIRMLNSLSWYELIQLLGIQEVKRLLSDQFINKLYPHQRRIFYSSAKQLLSKYNLPTTG